MADGHLNEGRIDKDKVRMVLRDIESTDAWASWGLATDAIKGRTGFGVSVDSTEVSLLSAEFTYLAAARLYESAFNQKWPYGDPPSLLGSHRDGAIKVLSESAEALKGIASGRIEMVDPVKANLFEQAAMHAASQIRVIATHRMKDLLAQSVAKVAADEFRSKMSKPTIVEQLLGLPLVGPILGVALLVAVFGVVGSCLELIGCYTSHTVLVQRKPDSRVGGIASSWADCESPLSGAG